MLVDLSNEVYFKKVFTDTEVFKMFVKDVLNIDLNISKVETEKVLPKASSIQFKMDLFAEDKANRTIVEIQKVDLTYNYSRFLHYFMSNLLDIQRDSKTYDFAKAVYLVVVVTGKTVLKDLDGKPIICDALLTNLNPERLASGEKYRLHKHKMLILNPNYLRSDTPVPIREWLTFISESIKNPEHPKINLNHQGIVRAMKLAEADTVTPEERFEAKDAYSRKEKLAETEKKGIEKGKIESILGLHKNRVSIATISKALNMTEEKIQEIIKLKAKK